MRTTEHLVKLARQLSTTAERLPGAGLVQKEYEIIEDALLQSMHQRMKRAVSRSAESPVALPPPANSDNIDIAEGRVGLSPGQRLQSIMAEALEQTTEQALSDWAHRILDQLLPDEARLLSAFSSGDSYAVIGVSASRSITGPREILLSNISSVGKAAQVKAREPLPSYIARLKTLGLIERRGPSNSLELDYQILESDTRVQQALNEAQAGNYSRIRTERGTIKLSATGNKLWQICTQHKSN